MQDALCFFDDSAYIKKAMNLSILIIGPDINLRGVGGVTIHVRRLQDYLDKIGYKYLFKDYKSISLWELCKEISRHRLVHVHISNPIYQFIVVLMIRLFGKRAVVTFHGDYGRFGTVKNWLVRCSMKLATVPIVINEKSYEACQRFNQRTILIPAFIPPQKDEVLQTEVVALFDRLRNEGRKIFSTNASNVAVDKYGNDIYGIDFLIQIFKDSTDKALVISDPSGNYEKRYHDLDSNGVFFINYPHSYFEVLKRTDYSVRNTSTDGDALSVKESLYLGKTTLCTDAVDRPKGVRLFKYCDRTSFEKSINTDNEGTSVVENGAEKIVQVYKSVS